MSAYGAKAVIVLVRPLSPGIANNRRARIVFDRPLCYSHRQSGRNHPGNPVLGVNDNWMEAEITITTRALIGLSLTAAIFSGAQSIPASAHWVGSHAGPAASLDTSDCEIATGVPVPSDENVFTPSEVKQLYTGKTGIGVTEIWTHGAGYYAPDGTLKYFFKGKGGSGWWRAGEDGNICLKVPAWWGNEEMCHFRLYHDGDWAATGVNTKYLNSAKDYLQPKSKSKGCYTEGNNLR